MKVLLKRLTIGQHANNWFVFGFFLSRNPTGIRLPPLRMEINTQELNQLNPTKTPDVFLTIWGFLSYSQHTHLVA